MKQSFSFRRQTLMNESTLVSALDYGLLLILSPIENKFSISTLSLLEFMIVISRLCVIVESLDKSLKCLSN